MTTIVIKSPPVIRVVKVTAPPLPKIISKCQQGPAGVPDYSLVFKIENALSELQTAEQKQAALNNLGALKAPDNLKNGEVLQVAADVVSAKHQWITLVTAFTVKPSLLATIAAGKVYQYQYGNLILYRLISVSADAFYSAYDATAQTVSGLVAAKQIIIAI